MLHVSGDSFNGVLSGYLRVPVSDALSPNPVSDTGLDDIRASLLSSSALTADASGDTRAVQNDMGIRPADDDAYVTHIITVDQKDSFYFPQAHSNSAIIHLPPTPSDPTQSDEVDFIAGVNSTGTIVSPSYGSWNSVAQSNTFNATSGTSKWGAGIAGTAGGTVKYYFDPAATWTANEQAVYTAAYTLWSDLTNIQFVVTADPAQANIVIKRGVPGDGAYFQGFSNGSGGAGTVGTTNIWHFKTDGTPFISIATADNGFGPIDINAPGNSQGYVWGTVVHEEGHSLGLGHGGAYNGNNQSAIDQYSLYDTTQWAIMSYVPPDDANAKYSKGTNTTAWLGGSPTTPMALDILAAQQLYGLPVTTAYSGGQIFGFNCNISDASKPFYDFTVNTAPIVTLWDAGTNNTLDLSGFGTATTVNLNPGTFSSCAGMTNNIGIAFNTQINTFIGGAGNDTVTANNNGDLLKAGSGGTDIFTGGTANDGFYFGASFDASDRANGGAGTNNQVGLEGDYSGGATISGTQFQNVQVLALLPGFNYNLTLTNDLTAAASTFTVWAVKLGGANSASVDASGELDANLVFYMGAGNDTVKGGALADTIYGEGGKDTLTGGLGADTFAYLGATDSSSTNFDVINDFSAAGGDKFKLGIAITSVNIVVGAQALATASFDADVAAAVNASLDATHPALFVAGAGNYTGHTFLVVEAGGGVGYQANSDYVFDLIGGGAGLASGNFI